MSETKWSSCAYPGCGLPPDHLYHKFGRTPYHAFTPAPPAKVTDSASVDNRLTDAPEAKPEPRCPTCAAPLGDHAKGDLKRCRVEAKPAEACCETCGATMRGTYCPACYDPGAPEAAMSEEEFEALNYGLAPQRRLHVEARRARAEEKRLREQIETILNDPGYNALRQSEQALREALEEIAEFDDEGWARRTAAAALRGVKK